jgi:hypothetical protein
VLVNGIGRRLRPASEEAMVRGLLRLDAQARAKGAPRIIQLLANSDDEDPPALSLGLGGEDCVLVFNEGDWSGEGGFSKGPHRGDKGEVCFAYGDSHSFYQRWMLVDRDTAIAAAREFYRTGRRPKNVRWKDL